VKIHYTEQIKGQQRVFEQEATVAGASENEAKAAAEKHFESLTLDSGVGWHREIVSIEILSGPGPVDP
jgi:hypothetical protein